MKLSISNIAWNDSENLLVYESMKKFGFCGLEVAPGKVCHDPNECKDDEIAGFLNDIQKNDIEIVSLQSLLYGKADLNIFGNLKSRNDTLNYLKNIIILAKKIGSKNLVFGSPKNRTIPNGLRKVKVAGIAYDFFSEIGDFASKNNIFFCLEPNPKSYGTNFLNTIQETVDFLKIVNNGGLKLIVDTSEIIINKEKYDAILDSIISHVSHFHISEPNLSPLSLRYQGLHLKLAAILNKLDYNGYVSIEMKSNGIDNMKNVTNALDMISKIYSHYD